MSLKTKYDKQMKLMTVCNNKSHEKRVLDIKSKTRFNFGRGGGIRTHDPLLPKQMRYQAALRPEALNYTRLAKFLPTAKLFYR